MTQLGPLTAPYVCESSWYIHTTPPLKRLGQSETLIEGDLPPGASMYLGFDGEKPEAPFLESSLMSQLGDASEQEVAAPASVDSAGYINNNEQAAFEQQANSAC